jgi:hypothetical protein
VIGGATWEQLRPCPRRAGRFSLSSFLATGPARCQADRKPAGDGGHQGVLANTDPECDLMLRRTALGARTTRSLSPRPARAETPHF